MLSLVLLKICKLPGKLKKIIYGDSREFSGLISRDALDKKIQLLNFTFSK